jgi:Flp pilus assembly pilin Flp
MEPIYLFLNRIHLELDRVTSRQEGQALIEYVLIVTLIALVAITALQSVGTGVRGALTTIAGDV